MLMRLSTSSGVGVGIFVGVGVLIGVGVGVAAMLTSLLAEEVSVLFSDSRNRAGSSNNPLKQQNTSAVMDSPFFKSRFSAAFKAKKVKIIDAIIKSGTSPIDPYVEALAAPNIVKSEIIKAHTPNGFFRGFLGPSILNGVTTGRGVPQFGQKLLSNSVPHLVHFIF